MIKPVLLKKLCKQGNLFINFDVVNIAKIPDDDHSEEDDVAVDEDDEIEVIEVINGKE